MAFSFNGTTQTGVTGTPKITDAAYSENADKIEISGSADTDKEFEAGQADKEASITIRGGSAVEVGDTFAFTITWNDSTSSALTTAVVVGKETSGSLNNPISTKLTMVPTTTPPA
jgi:hypothetical protein